MARNEKTILGYEMLDRKKIKRSAVKKAVRKKLNGKDEVVIMKTSVMKKLAIAGAVAGTILLSFTTVNAATGGAVVDKVSETFSKVRIMINGKEVEKDAIVRSEDGDTIVFEVSGDGLDDEITVEMDDDALDEEDEVTIHTYEYNGDENVEVGAEIPSSDVIYELEKGNTAIIEPKK